MLISIITPTYNSIECVLDTYHSICSQTISDWEWVITDDCSTDGTYELLLELSRKDPRVILYRNSVNSGAAVSRNNSILNSKGDFLAFIDSDDIWLKDKLRNQIDYMELNDVDFTFTAYELIDENGNSLNKTVDTHLVKGLSYNDMLRKKATLGCSTVVIRKSAFGSITMPLIRTGQDYALWLKLLKTGAIAYPIPEVLTQYRILPNSISRNKIKKANRQWHIYRKIENISLLNSSIFFCFYAWRAVFRK